MIYIQNLIYKDIIFEIFEKALKAKEEINLINSNNSFSIYAQSKIQYIISSIRTEIIDIMNSLNKIKINKDKAATFTILNSILYELESQINNRSFIINDNYFNKLETAYILLNLN